MVEVSTRPHITSIASLSIAAPILLSVFFSVLTFNEAVAVVPAKSLSHMESEGRVLSVKEGHRIRRIKRSVVVRLSAPVHKDTLQKLGFEIHDKEPNFKRTFIEYYLPGMIYGSGAWATTHFDPKIEINILGLPIEDKTTSNLASDRTIGHWLMQLPAHHIWIHITGTKVILERGFQDGSFGTEQLIEVPSSIGRRFNFPNGSGSSDYYIVTESGHLEVRDEFGLIDSLKPAEK